MMKTLFHTSLVVLPLPITPLLQQYRLQPGMRPYLLMTFKRSFSILSLFLQVKVRPLHLRWVDLPSIFTSKDTNLEIRTRNLASIKTSHNSNIRILATVRMVAIRILATVRMVEILSRQLGNTVGDSHLIKTMVPLILSVTIVFHAKFVEEKVIRPMIAITEWISPIKADILLLYL